MSGRQHLPSPRGPITSWLLGHLRGGAPDPGPVVPTTVLDDDDAQLALHVVYELSYRGYDGVDERMERDVDVLALRHRLEDAMEAELRDLVGEVPDDPVALLERLAIADDGPSLSRFLEVRADLGMLREFAVHRSAYQLKEADPHSWALPRLSGRAKAALVEIQADEYGRGVPGAAHAELWAETMDDLGLDPAYGGYVDVLPATTLATGNLIGLLGLQHRLTPALLGHLALFEMTSTGPMARYSNALAAVGVPARGRRFFDVHVEADAYHEVLALTDLVGGYVEDHPEDAREVGFGALALQIVEHGFATHLMTCFEERRSSLRAPGRLAVAA